MHHRVWSLPAALLAIGAACARNRQAAEASIPAPLVSALLGDRGSATSTDPRYSVGALPPGYPGTLVPPGPVRIVGGMTMGGESVAVFADSTRRLAAIFEQLFEQAGFTRPPSTPGSGFISASGPNAYFCSDSGFVSAEPLAGANRHLVRVTYRRMRVGASCPARAHTTPAGVLELPELRPPAHVQVARSNAGSSTDAVSSSAQVFGAALSPSTVLSHYAAELVAAGWSTTAPAVGDRVAAQFFEAKDPSGAAWEGVLIAEGGGGALTLTLTMHPRPIR